MSRRRQRQRAAKKARRHDRQAPPGEPRWPAEPGEVAEPARVVVREARYVERLAYTRSQAAEALGVSRSTLRRLLPYVETIEMPWGGKLIPVDEMERLVTERRRAARVRTEPMPSGRRPALAAEVVGRIRAARAAGRTLRQIAADLNSDGTPTAHGGAQWWPSTVRAVLLRSAPVESARARPTPLD